MEYKEVEGKDKKEIQPTQAQLQIGSTFLKKENIRLKHELQELIKKKKREDVLKGKTTPGRANGGRYALYKQIINLTGQMGINLYDRDKSEEFPPKIAQAIRSYLHIRISTTTYNRYNKYTISELTTIVKKL